jgi:hypothetical protein
MRVAKFKRDLEEINKRIIAVTHIDTSPNSERDAEEATL